MQPAFRIAFYKGARPGAAGLYNWVVRTRGRGQYSHVEMVFSDGLSASASFSDGGVRFKKIDYSNAKDWDFIVLPEAWEASARAYFEAHAGESYDLMGNLHLAFGFVPEARRKKFCSEVQAGALGIDEPWRFEPNALYVVVARLVRAHCLYTSVIADL